MANYNLDFEDLYSFYRFAMTQSDSRTKISRKMYDLGWYGGVTWKEACQLATHGWEEGAMEVEKYRALLYENLVQYLPRQNIVNAVSGYAVDVGAYLSNSPECFYRREMNEPIANAPVVRIVVSLAFSASVRPEIITKRGAMICAMVDAIEQSGYSVEIIGNEAVTSRGKNSEINIILKQSTRALNVASLAFCLAHPAMLRRLLFSAEEKTGWADFAYEYGTPIDASEPGDIYFGAICTSVSPSIEDMTEDVLSMMKSIGIGLLTREN